MTKLIAIGEKFIINPEKITCITFEDASNPDDWVCKINFDHKNEMTICASFKEIKEHFGHLLI
jgi:hypothetical protein